MRNGSRRAQIGEFLENVSSIEDIYELLKILNYPENAIYDPSYTRDLENFEFKNEINKIVLQNIEEVYKEYEQSKNQDTAFKELSKNRGSKFIITLTQEIELQIFDYLYDFPDDTKYAMLWDQVLRKLSLLKYTKKRLSEMRKMWKSYKQSGDWKLLIDNLDEYCKDKGLRESEDVIPFNINKLQLITVDFIS